MSQGPAFRHLSAWPVLPGLGSCLNGFVSEKGSGVPWAEQRRLPICCPSIEAQPALISTNSVCLVGPGASEMQLVSEENGGLGAKKDWAGGKGVNLGGSPLRLTQGQLWGIFDHETTWGIHPISSTP